MLPHSFEKPPADIMTDQKNYVLFREKIQNLKYYMVPPSFFSFPLGVLDRKKNLANNSRRNLQPWQKQKQNICSSIPLPLHRKKKATVLQCSSFIKDGVVFFHIKRRFRKKFPNFSGALGFRCILYIFSTRCREIKCLKNKRACSTLLKSNRKALNRKVQQQRPHQTHGPKPLYHNSSPGSFGSNEIYPEAEGTPTVGSHFSFTHTGSQLLCPSLLRKFKPDC